MSTGRAGIVLAGCDSRRFGEADKALAPVDGTPMVARVVECLGRVVEGVVVSCRDSQREDFERALEEFTPEVAVAFANDPVPDRGPLAGTRTALQAAEADSVAVVGCDVPGLPRFWTSCSAWPGDTTLRCPKARRIIHNQHTLSTGPTRSNGPQSANWGRTGEVCAACWMHSTPC